MSKLWSWMKKRDPNSAALSEAHARVERAARALAPYSPALRGTLAAQLAAAQDLRRDAQETEQRGEPDSAEQALRAYEQVVAQLVAVRRGVLAEHPALVLHELLARAEQLADEIENKSACCEAWLRVFSGYLAAGDGAAAERVSERVLDLAEKHADARQAVGLVRQFYALQPELARAPWVAAARARVLAQLHGWDEDDPERDGNLFTLLEVQAERDDLAGARATLERIEGEFRDEGLRVLVGAQARAGDLAGARALAATITDAALLHQTQVDIVAALARTAPAEALVAAHALDDEDARAQALGRLAGAYARAGQHDAALALCAEIEESWQDEARLEILEGQLAGGELVAAEHTLESLTSDELRTIGWSRIGSELARSTDPAAALALAQRIPEPYAQASALEHLGWTRIRAGDEETAHSAFGHALELASDIARHSRGARSPGTVGQHWLLLASRIQVALGDSTSALTCILGFDDPDQRGAALLGIGQVCGLMGDLGGVEALLENLSTPFDRSWILDGAAAGLVSRARK